MNAPQHVGTLEAIHRYPVKSMAGEELQDVMLGWHGLEGDRRLGLRRLGDRAGFPWLTASRMPELLLYRPMRRDPETDFGLPSHVQTPSGAVVSLFSEALAAEIGQGQGTPVEMTHFDRGIFDEAAVSAITTATVDAIAALTSGAADLRRFRPNLLISTSDAEAYSEDAWVGGTLTFGEDPDAAVLAITNRDERCAMINLDPDTAERDPTILKSVVRERDNKAGVYGTVLRRGRLKVGQTLHFTPGS